MSEPMTYAHAVRTVGELRFELAGLDDSVGINGIAQTLTDTDEVHVYLRKDCQGATTMVLDVSA